MTPIFTALSREAGIAAEGLASGVTLLGKANSWQHGWYSHAFFSLSTGLERTAKLVVMLDHYIDRDGQFPTDAQLRAYGHDIVMLLVKAEQISQHRRPSEDYAVLPSTSIHHGIIKTISEFASTTRYYNLDLLIQGRNASLEDPLASWFTRVGQPILEAHYNASRRERDERDAEASQRLRGGYLMVRGTTEAGDPITSISESYMHEARAKIIRKWTSFYVLEIARFLAFLLVDLGDAAQVINSPAEDIPYMRDFFGIFMNPDSFLKSRKTWSAMRR